MSFCPFLSLSKGCIFYAPGHGLQEMPCRCGLLGPCPVTSPQVCLWQTHCVFTKAGIYKKICMSKTLGYPFRVTASELRSRILSQSGERSEGAKGAGAACCGLALPQSSPPLQAAGRPGICSQRAGLLDCWIAQGCVAFMF